MNLSQEIAKDDTLTGLLRKATDTKNGLLPDTTQDQRYEIKVTDQNGVALAKDRIMLESATGKQITMNVDEFTRLGRSEIAAMFATL